MNIEDRARAKEHVLRLAKEQGVKFIRLCFTDILGFLKSFAITFEELETALESGSGFDGSSIHGFARIDESDMVALPDPSTFQILPRQPKEHKTASMFCDIHWPGELLFEGDPRYVLKRNLKRAADLGYTFYVGTEMEYFYFQDSQSPQFLDQGGYFDLTPPDIATDLRRETILVLEEMGIGVEYCHHEAAPSQHEIVLRYTDALTMADNVMTYKLVVKQVAQEHGVYATFMPKPVFDVNGSGMHVHMSLFKGNRNAFFDENDPYHLSKTAKHFAAGLLKHAPEITSITNQWVNSYKRLIPGYEAPVYITWARRNRADLIRIPEHKLGKENATRIEFRSPDPACNPYLALSVMLAAGLEGMEEEYEPSPPLERNVFEMTEEERREKNIGTLPGSLYEALQLSKESELVRKALGQHVFNTFIQNGQLEWDRYRSQVTDYELRRYLPIL
ncbi:MAG: type I glutamate--ammonia ligase [Dehalococcoidia bacterium]|nr:type I glutamate--ammonia ligase [Dehalococcoidia bacterium]